MLVLSRKIGEVVRLNDDISIKLIAIKGNRARLAISAPSKVAVHRQEVYEQIHQAASEESH